MNGTVIVIAERSGVRKPGSSRNFLIAEKM
jgi:hypothetical protein